MDAFSAGGVGNDRIENFFAWALQSCGFPTQCGDWNAMLTDRKWLSFPHLFSKTFGAHINATEVLAEHYQSLVLLSCCLDQKFSI